MVRGSDEMRPVMMCSIAHIKLEQKSSAENIPPLSGGLNSPRFSGSLA